MKTIQILTTHFLNHLHIAASLPLLPKNITATCENCKPYCSFTEGHSLASWTLSLSSRSCSKIAWVLLRLFFLVYSPLLWIVIYDFFPEKLCSEVFCLWYKCNILPIFYQFFVLQFSCFSGIIVSLKCDITSDFFQIKMWENILWHQYPKAEKTRRHFTEKYLVNDDPPYATLCTAARSIYEARSYQFYISIWSTFARVKEK